MDKSGMRNIAHKVETLRVAVAESVIRMHPDTMTMLNEGRAPKGDPLPHARISAIMGAKKTSELIPYCHPLLIDCVTVEFEFSPDALRILVEVTAVAKTGVEMEAMTGASMAALTIYDMLKPVDKDMEILSCRLLSKKGGKSSYPRQAESGLRATVLVTSDSAAAGAREDQTGGVLRDRLSQAGFTVTNVIVVRDDVPAILELLQKQVADGIHLILTTGGTGLGPRDVTVEATRQIITREAPGIAEALRAYGQKRTPFAMMSQGIAGIAGNTLIVNLPGSPSGVEDSLNTLFPALFHAFPMMNGDGHA